eukprot:6103942-Pleurochrysis_carterae.AAC.1
MSSKQAQTVLVDTTAYAKTPRSGCLRITEAYILAGGAITIPYHTGCGPGFQRSFAARQRELPLFVCKNDENLGAKYQEKTWQTNANSLQEMPAKQTAMDTRDQYQAERQGQVLRTQAVLKLFAHEVVALHQSRWCTLRT